MSNDRRFLQGHILLPGPLPGPEAQVSLSLIEAGLADDAARVLTRQSFAISGLVSGPIEFRLEAPREKLPRERWLLDAAVTADATGRLAPGDYVLDHSVEWRDRQSTQPVKLVLKRVT